MEIHTPNLQGLICLSDVTMQTLLLQEIDIDLIAVVGRHVLLTRHCRGGLCLSVVAPAAGSKNMATRQHLSADQAKVAGFLTKNYNTRSKPKSQEPVLKKVHIIGSHGNTPQRYMSCEPAAPQPFLVLT